jgi:hypothetical protein
VEPRAAKVAEELEAERARCEKLERTIQAMQRDSQRLQRSNTVLRREVSDLHRLCSLRDMSDERQQHEVEAARPPKLRRRRTRNGGKDDEPREKTGKVLPSGRIKNHHRTLAPSKDGQNFGKDVRVRSARSSSQASGFADACNLTLKSGERAAREHRSQQDTPVVYEGWSKGSVSPSSSSGSCGSTPRRLEQVKSR